MGDGGPGKGGPGVDEARPVFGKGRVKFYIHGRVGQRIPTLGAIFTILSGQFIITTRTDEGKFCPTLGTFGRVGR